MTLFALALVLAAACSHAIWNLLVKKIDGGPELVWLFSSFSVLLYLPVAIAIVVIEEPRFGPRELAFCALSAMLHMAYFLLLQQGYRRGDLSLVYPTARATGPFLSTVFAVVVLGETLTPPVLAGGAAIIVGVVFLTGGFNRQAKQVGSSIVFGLAAGTLIGSYTIFDAYTVRTILVPPLLLDYASSIGRMIFLSPYAMLRKETVRAHWHNHKFAVLAIAVFNPLAYILVLIALTFTPVVYVAPARESSVLITVLLGTVLLREGSTRQRMAWSLLILAGMVLLATA
jgi:drug/metabolite transporter (DMT)-like permease